MSRLIAVSNRLPTMPLRGGTFDLPAGGLVSCLFDALRRNPGGGIWLGWNPDSRTHARSRRAHSQGVDLIGLSLDTATVDGYYHGFCNQTLWPILHGFPTRASFDLHHLAQYRRAQHRFARALLAELRPRDRVWIHDYHLFLLPELLRRGGFRGRIGFFLHTPFPSADAWFVLPAAGELLESLDRADLIGLQSRGDAENLRSSRRRLALIADTVARRRTARRAAVVAIVPAGIEAADYEPDATVDRRPKTASRLAQWVGGRRVLLGVDRLDYSKGLIERFHAYRSFLEHNPEWRRRVCLVQIASPSRGGLVWYRRERLELERQVGRINGELGEVDWMPIRYLHRSFSREELARIYRGADVGLVTPLRDGMNLVAKEFVAAQRPSDPGVLVLSRFAGASETLRDALLVNPYVIEETSDAIRRALEMPIEERRWRHRRLRRVVRRDSASRWSTRFLDRLAKCG